MDNIGVYVSALQESLQKKLDVLLELLKLTKEQGAILLFKHPLLSRDLREYIDGLFLTEIL